ncbi:MAG: CHAD domain-containing protein [Pseudomonadota bacterium]
MKVELELKLALSARELKRLRRDPLIRSLAYKRASSKRLHSVYFDTPALDLRRHGMALRVRTIGSKHIQTLKVPGSGASGLQDNREYEADLATELPDVSKIDDGQLRSLFEEQGWVDALKPLFITAFNRTTVPLKFEESEVELALDQGEIFAGARCRPICEAELELVSGSSLRLYELASALHKRFAFRLETRSKAARGYALHQNLPPKPVKARPTAIAQEMTVAEGFAAAARNCLQQMRANEAVVLAGENEALDPEGIHQLRVGVRRLRALVTVFKGVMAEHPFEILRSELSWLQTALGPAREWDVFVEETLEPLCQRLPGDPDLAAMTEAAGQRRIEANRAAQQALASTRYTALILTLERFLNSGAWAAGHGGEASPDDRIGKFTASALQRRAAKLHKLTRKWKTLPEAELHAVRILGKKLRYTIEFFQGIYESDDVRTHLEVIKRIQDCLGSLNDAVTNTALLEDLEDTASQQALASVKGWQAACIERDLADFREDLKAYEKCKAYWT